MSRFEKFDGRAMIDVRSLRRPTIGAWFHGSLRAGSENHEASDSLISYRIGQISDKLFSVLFSRRMPEKTPTLACG